MMRSLALEVDPTGRLLPPPLSHVSDAYISDVKTPLENIYEAFGQEQKFRHTGRDSLPAELCAPSLTPGVMALQ